MKKQINPTLKAHLIRGAFYLLLLVAVCAIPLALAQRNAAKRGIANPGANRSVFFNSVGVPQPLPPSTGAALNRSSSVPASASAPDICSNYTFTLGTGTFVPGVTNIGQSCDDCLTPITLPFPVTLYDQVFTTAMVGSNGSLQFGMSNATFGITCSPFGVAGTTYAMGPYWDDLIDFCTGCGVFTTTTGTAPNRIFYIEYRSEYFAQPLTLDFEVALYENGTPPFQFIYNTITPLTAANDSQLVVGVKKDDTTFTQYGCDTTGGENPPVSSGQTLTATCVLATPSPTPTASPCEGPWQLAANMPTDLYGAAGASDGTFFYAAGGYSFSSGTTLAVFNRYDPVADTWTPLPDMPQAAIMATAVYDPANNKIYVFGGEDAVSGTNYNITRIYDIASNTWSTGAIMPGVISFAAGGYASNTGKIYILSGYNTGQVTSAQPNTWAYDPVADSWTDLTASAPFPHPVGGAAYGVLGCKLYVAGGRDAANMIVNLNWQYDPVANAYTQKADEPGTFQNNVPGSAAASGKLFVFGGGNPFTGANAMKAGLTSMDKPNTVSKRSFPWSLFKQPAAPDTDNSGRFYDPVSDTWTSSPNMNVARSFPSGGAIGEFLIIAAGGYNGTTTVASVEKETVCGAPLICTTTSPTPTATASPTPTPTPTCTPSGSKIYNIAGFTLGGQTNTTRIYDIATNTWTTGAPLPSMLSDHATAYWNGKIYVAGGFNGSGATNALWIYDIASDNWTSGPAMPVAVFLPGFGIINGKLYIASGNDGTSERPELQVYDIASNSWSIDSSAPVTTPVTGPGSAVFQGKLYVFGGSAPFPNNITTTQIFDPVANSWTTGGNMVVPRLWFYGGNLDDTSIVAPGGDNPVGIPINDNELYNGTSWSEVAPLPYNARGPFCVSDGTFYYIGGGYDGSSVHTDTLRYDPVANTYTNLAPAPDPHYLSQAVIVPGVGCGTPTPTATATATFTPTPTATATATATATNTPTPTATPTPTPTPTPQATPTPRPRPTPAPRP